MPTVSSNWESPIYAILLRFPVHIYRKKYSLTCCSLYGKGLITLRFLAYGYIELGLAKLSLSEDLDRTIQLYSQRSATSTHGRER